MVLGRKRIETKVTAVHGGMHDTDAWIKIKSMIESNDYTAARLYHVVLTPLSKNNKREVKDYQDAWKAICLKLTRAGIAHKWRACIELDDEKEVSGKGLHWHVFLMLEGHSETIPDQLINTKTDGWLRLTLNARHIQLTIAKPRDRIQWREPRQSFDSDAPLYAALPKTNPAKIASCTEWISYLVKRRSKNPINKTTYFSSRDRKSHASTIASPSSDQVRSTFTIQQLTCGLATPMF